MMMGKNPRLKRLMNYQLKRCRRLVKRGGDESILIHGVIKVCGVMAPYSLCEQDLCRDPACKCLIIFQTIPKHVTSSLLRILYIWLSDK